MNWSPLFYEKERNNILNNEIFPNTEIIYTVDMSDLMLTELKKL